MLVLVFPRYTATHTLRLLHTSVNIHNWQILNLLTKMFLIVFVFV